MIPVKFLLLLNFGAGTFLVLAQTIYIIQVIKKEITPSLFTWLGWFILVSVALISQLAELGWNWTLVAHLFSAIGCTGIFLSAYITKNYVVVSKDYVFLYLGLACIVIYVLFKDPWFTTIFAILADGILGMPTILKAVKSPKTEKSIGWNIALVCWAMTLITCINNNLLFFLFPAYCFAFNLIMSFLTRQKRIRLF